MEVFMLLLLSTLLAAAPPAPAPAWADTTRTMAGVKVPEAIDVNGHRLALNGLALRKKAIFKVYVAALYVAAKSTNPDDLLGADQPRRMVMHFLRNVSKKQVCEAWDEGFEKNTPGPSAELKQQFKQLCDMMADIKDDQEMVFTYVPEQGTTVLVAGKEKGAIGGKEFADAILRTWIGPKPGPGEGFKKDILGKD
jgi:hypothetical protein